MSTMIRTTVLTAILVGSATGAYAQSESSTTASPATLPAVDLSAPAEEPVLESRAKDEAEVKPAPPTLEKPRIDMGEFFLVPALQVRPRFFAHGGRDFTPGTDAVFVTNRLRLGFTLGHSNGVEVTVRVQDIRVWGEETSTLDFDANGVDFHEGYGTIPLFGLGSLKVGRQEIVLDDERLVGALDWAQRGRSFDGLFLNLGIEKLQLDVFAAKVREADQDADGSVADGRSGDIDFVGFHPTTELFGQKLALVYLFNGDYEAQNTTHTVGGSVHALIAERLSYRAEFYFQTGQRGGVDVDGVLAAGNVGYQMIGVGGKPKLSIWGEYVGGRFDTLYATNHKFYGEMDLFLNLPVHTLGLGLVDLGGRAEVFPVKDLRLNVDFHHFRSGGDEDAAGNSSFGSELNFKVTYKLWKFIGTRLLYGVFLPGELMRTRFGVAAGTDLQVEHLLYWTLDFQI